jgi:hypothetical protein
MVKIILVIVLSLSINTLSSDNKFSKNVASENVSVKLDGDKAPDFSLKSVDGKTINFLIIKVKLLL